MGTTDRMPLPDAPGRESPVEGTDFFSSSPVFFSAGHTSGGSGKAFVTRDRIQLARKADLAGFLIQRHPDLFRNSGSSLYMKSRDSLYIRKGFPGYTDFSSGGHGNPIDFLRERSPASHHPSGERGKALPQGICLSARKRDPGRYDPPA